MANLAQFAWDLPAVSRKTPLVIQENLALPDKVG